MENRVNIKEPKPGSTVVLRSNQGNTDRNGVFFCRRLSWLLSFPQKKVRKDEERRTMRRHRSNSGDFSLCFTSLRVVLNDGFDWTGGSRVPPSRRQQKNNKPSCKKPPSYLHNLSILRNCLSLVSNSPGIHMRHIIAGLLLLLSCFGTQAAEKQYVIYLHGAIVEGSNGEPVHPQYGKYDYYAIIKALQAKGYIVLSEIRPLATNSEQYAEKISARADSLKKAGIHPENITVIGASKGGQIAMFVSTSLKDKKMKFVIMGGCNEYIDLNPKLDLHGHFLSICEESDIIGKSCNTLMQASKKVSSYNEVLLHTGLKHGFLYQPLKEWMDPVSAWIEGTH